MNPLDRSRPDSPVHKASSSRRRLPFIAAALIASWSIGVVAVVWSGTLPDPYLQHVRGIAPPHPYAFKNVAWVTAFITAQVALMYAILRPRTFRRSWGRAACAFAMSAGFAWFALMSAIHAPPFWIAYVWWQLATAALFLSLVLVAVAGRLARRESMSLPRALRRLD